MTHEDYMLFAFDEAFTGMRSNKGGPFGSVIVSDGIVIGKGHNMVTSTNDPTAHAEVVAIRNACRAAAAFHLPNAVLYTSCEPCPMCLAAIYWANIKTVYYCADRIDAARIGFDDKFIYEELIISPSKRIMKVEQLHLPISNELFNEWTDKQDKTSY
ncbi:MAG: nucleoside deaminase [Flavobacteriales bacterium]|nr:nucleoside deaminase [Flavobacteriales bacterium]